MAEFDVNKYWLERGRTYMSEERLKGPYHRLQEQFLFEVIQRGELPAQNVLELGCGFGRVTRLLSEHLPQSKITAVDPSVDQLNNARVYCGGKHNITFGSYDFYSEAPLPGERYDLTIAVEVFLHHPAEVVLKLIKAVSQVSTCIVNIDWSEPWRWRTPTRVGGEKRIGQRTPRAGGWGTPLKRRAAARVCIHLRPGAFVGLALSLNVVDR